MTPRSWSAGMRSRASSLGAPPTPSSSGRAPVVWTEVAVNQSDGKARRVELGDDRRQRGPPVCVLALARQWTAVRRPPASSPASSVARFRRAQLFNGDSRLYFDPATEHVLQGGQIWFPAVDAGCVGQEDHRFSRSTPRTARRERGVVLVDVADDVRVHAAETAGRLPNRHVRGGQRIRQDRFHVFTRAGARVPRCRRGAGATPSPGRRGVRRGAWWSPRSPTTRADPPRTSARDRRNDRRR